MELNFSQCYEALQSRDPRFDGLFFTGVLSTGIYCRPICPARTPKAENVRFFQHPAEAEEQGLRPCLRCRPESAPGTPAWQGTGATVSRGLRLLAGDFADELTLEDLARQLGVSSRQVRRLFQEHLGASPVAVAQLFRVQLAMRLLRETRLPMTEVAFASGFRSVRRFNAVIKATFGAAPREIRPVKAGGPVSSGEQDLSLRLNYRPPMQLAYLLAYFAGRATPGVEAVGTDGYHRTVSFHGVSGVISVRPLREAHGILLTVPPALTPWISTIVERTRRLFDLYCMPGSVEAHLGGDPLFASMVAERPGLRLPGAWDPFEIAIRAILGQQVSVRGATTLAGRVAQTFGEALGGDAAGGLTHLFPTAASLAEAPLETVGLPRARAHCIRTLSAAVASGEMKFEYGAASAGLVEQLCTFPGIGPWTAQYVAMRALGDPDAFPIDDLGLIKAIERKTGEVLRGKALLARAEAWRPWRAYAVQYLWASLQDS